MDQLTVKTNQMFKMAGKVYRFERAFSLLLALFLSSVCTAKHRKNVLLILVPNFRSFLCRNSLYIPYTPNLNLLSSSCLIFHNVYTQIPLPVPSTISLFTSRRPDTLKCYDDNELTANVITMPEYFEKYGYDTMSFGKVFSSGKERGCKARAYSHWSQHPFWPNSAAFDNESSCLYVDKSFKIRLVSNLVCPMFPEVNSHRHLPDEETVWAVKKFIKVFANNSNNFFMSVGFFRPDVPFRFPLKYLKLNPSKHITVPKLLVRAGEMPSVAWNPANSMKSFYDMKELNISYPFGILPVNDTKIVKQCYFASITYIDDMIGQLLQELGENKLFDKTIIAIVGVHGSSLGERGLWGGQSCYDTATRVPLLIYSSDLTTMMRFRKITHELVELVDIFPTLVDLAGLDPLERCPPNSADKDICTEGISLYPLFDSFSSSSILKKKKFKEWKGAVFSQVPRPNICPVKEVDSDFPRAAQINIMGYSIRTHRYKYIEWVKFVNMAADWSQVVARELYDFNIDPFESLNLASRCQFEGIIKRLREMLLAGWNSSLPIINEEDVVSENSGLETSNLPKFTTTKYTMERPNKTTTRKYQMFDILTYQEQRRLHH